MKPFSTIAIPHRDILEGRCGMDVFAADLWEVFKGSAPDEYKDPDIFFRKTYLTAGLKNLLDVSKKRLEGRGGDPVIQLQTPFGGGKTHSLIALYHKAREWRANVVVIDGTALDPKEKTIWEELEEQLNSGDGDKWLLKGKTSPGRNKLKEILEKHQPILILMDEILVYTTKASGIKIGDSNLASQVLAFIQELTMTVGILEKTLLILTLPSSILEHYDENSERLFQQLQKITGRMEKVYTSVQDEEISQVIRKRLFSTIDEKEAKNIIEEFLDYAEKEKILPEGVEKSVYREKFLKSYPFQPEVIDVLYKRWGSFPTFQRTRGVLRILALVVHSLKDSKNPFIRLGDFDLKIDEIRRELIKHIGQEYDSVIAADITSPNSGSKKVDRELGSAYSPFSFGTKAATTIFMFSFSGGPERGATINEIKLSSTDPSVPSSIVAEAVSKLKEHLFYLSDTGLFFTNQPNLNRILLSKMESIEDPKLEERELLTKSLTRNNFDIYIWPSNSKDISDTTRLKLVVLSNRESSKELLENCGERPRVYRNTLIFLCALESESTIFENSLRRKLAWQLIEKDKTLQLTEEQRKEIKNRIKKAEDEVREHLRSYYRIVLLPSKEGLKEIDLGISTFGADVTIDKEIYDRLRGDEILEKLSPLTLNEKYLKGKDYVKTKDIVESFYRTPGEMRIIKDDVFREAIREGVREGLFGLGILEDDKPLCRYFKKDCSPELVEGEIIIKENLCQSSKEENVQSEQEIYRSKEEKVGTKVKERVEKFVEQKDKYSEISLKFVVPKGKLSDIVRMVNHINTKFNQVITKIEIDAKDGEIAKSEYEDRIKETISQIECYIEEENLR